MPHKFNAARRHKFPKKRYRVTNWAEYTEILRRRGDLTIWVTDDTLKQWRAPRRTTPGGQPKYSNIAIEGTVNLMAAGERLSPIAFVKRPLLLPAIPPWLRCEIGEASGVKSGGAGR